MPLQPRLRERLRVHVGKRIVEQTDHLGAQGSRMALLDGWVAGPKGAAYTYGYMPSDIA